jgi:cytochrome c oxidase subunit 3
MMRQRPVQDISSLPTSAFGPRMTMWWGTLGFVTLEGVGFALSVGAYLYLAWLTPQWPLSPGLPDLFWSSTLTLIMLVSMWPNRLAEKNAKTHDLSRVRRDLIIMSLTGIVLVGVRLMEFAALPVTWDQNAYASAIWGLLALHTAHLATDVIDTMVLAVLMFTRHARGKRFSDVEDKAFYWYFVVASWLPIYLLLYWAPRV